MIRSARGWALAVIAACGGLVAATTAGLVSGGQSDASRVASAVGRGAISSTRVPVVLVPGWSDDAGELATLRRRFLQAGWDSSRVAALSFDDPYGSNRDHARELARAVVELARGNGVERVDVVAHSMGGLATRYYLQNGGAERVRRVAFLGSPHLGTQAAWLAWGEGGREMEPGSPFLLALTQARPVPAGIEAITIRTPVDLRVFPGESATLPGIPDIEICCPTHPGLLDDVRVFERVLLFVTHE